MHLLRLEPLPVGAEWVHFQKKLSSGLFLRPFFVPFVDRRAIGGAETQPFAEEPDLRFRSREVDDGSP
jgi:hypothetical protein